MCSVGQDPYPLPGEPSLSEAARAMRDAGHWGWVVDKQWRLVYVTDEIRRTFGGDELVSFSIGNHFFGTEAAALSRSWRLGMNTVDLIRRSFTGLGGLVLFDTPGGRDALREIVDPSLRDIVDDLKPADPAALFFMGAGTGLSGVVHDVPVLSWRVRNSDGRLAGTALISKPAPGMATLSAVSSEEDPRHLTRMQLLARAGRRPAAMLFGDLEASTPLARRLSTASYFMLGRRLVRSADRSVIDAGGLVGRHAGDGVVAFFLAEVLGSESAAARACITAARRLRLALSDVAAQSHLEPEEVVFRFGLHWGSTLYVGSISTGGRSEVTALGDEVNEAARIEACAVGGRALASKDLIERLEPQDAADLSIDAGRITYTELRSLEAATDKVRRDAPALAVCDV